MIYKKCKICLIDKLLSDFRNHITSKRSWIEAKCFSCEKTYNKTKNSSDIQKKNRKLYRENNRKKLNEYDKVRMMKDVKYRLRKRVSHMIRFSLKNKKENSIINFLPYSFQELKEHLEKQFEPWMTWDNHGSYKKDDWEDDNLLTWKWQIDHIIPQSDLLYTSMTDDNFKKCWALKNLRPLNAKQNAKDGGNKIRHISQGVS